MDHESNPTKRSRFSSLLQLQNQSSQSKADEQIERDFTSTILIGDLTDAVFKEDLKKIRRVAGEDESTTAACKTLIEEVENILNEEAKNFTEPSPSKQRPPMRIETTQSHETASLGKKPPDTASVAKNQSEMINAMNNSYQSQPFKALANIIDPKHLLGIIHERLECHKKVDINATTAMNSTTSSSDNSGNGKVKCVPSARTINCPHHCVAILGTRLFAMLCNESAFQQRLMGENQEYCFNYIVDILYPNNDPVNSLFL
jgi:hypothetical protein